MRRLHTAALVAAVAAASLLRAQEPALPSFRVAVDAVQIDASVTDAEGNLVTNLTAEDFEIYEDDRRQEITSFSLVDIPIERIERPLYSATAIEPDVHTNDGPEGRLYIIALDEVPASCALRFRHFMRRFLEEQFAANDVAAIVYVGRGRSIDTQDFTSNRRLLIEAMERYSGGSGAGPGEGPNQTRSRMSQLRALLEFAANLRGRRKTMIYVTRSLGDIDRVLDYNGTTLPHALEDLHAAMAAATRGNVSIYPLDPAGLSPGGRLGDEGILANPGCGELATSLDDMMDLRSMARATGGFALVNSNSFEAAFERIVRENSTYYVLGFTSTNDRRDGRFRRVEVRVRRPGLQVRARGGYVAPLGRAPGRQAEDPALSKLSAGVADAIRMPLEETAVPMSVFAAPFKGNGRDASVAITVEVDARHLGLIDVGGRISGELELTSAAIAASARVFHGERQRSRVNLLPDSWERARTAGIRLLSHLTLPPGRYQLRVAVGNVTGRAGSVMYDLEVPDFSRQPFAMSGLAITAASTGGALVLADRDPLRGMLPGSATATREFPRGERVALYAEVYENRRDRAAHTVSLKAELRSDEGRVLQTVEEERKSTELEGNTGGYGFRAEIPLDAEPGLYVIHVEARANISGQPTASRDIQIRVK